MQPGCKDNFEACYTIKLYVKFDKNTTESYEMLQTTYELTCTRCASVFRWLNTFKDGRYEITVDGRCEERDIRKSELIEKNRNFLDEDSLCL